jgi:PAS domain S-box-containing protein
MAGGEAVLGDPGRRGAEPPLAQMHSLHRLTVALYEARSPEEFYREAVRAVLGTAGADRAALLLTDADGVMRFKAWERLSAGYRAAAEGHTPWASDDPAPQPVLVPDVALDAGLAGLQGVFTAEGIGALGFIPLVRRGRLAGEFMLYYDRPHAFGPDEVSVAEVLAAQVAVALERWRSEDELRRSEQRYRRLLEASAEAFIASDPEGRITDWNRQAELTFGWTCDEVTGRPLADVIIPPRYREAHRLGLARFRESGEAPLLGQRVEFEGLRRDGAELPLEISIWLVEGPEEEASFCALVRDIAERRRQARAERQALARAEASAARLAILAEVTAALSVADSTDEVAAAILRTAQAEVGADRGSLCLLDGDELVLTHTVGYPADVLAHGRRFPLDADLPASEAVRERAAVFVRSVEERDRRYPVLRTTPVIHDQALAVVPLVVSPLGTGRPIGSLVLGFAHPRDFTKEEEDFLYLLANRCAGALERARLSDERERAREVTEQAWAEAERAKEEAERAWAEAERAKEEAEWAREEAERAGATLAFLAEASELLGGAMRSEQTVDRLVALAVPRLADGCAVYLVEEGAIRLVALNHREPGQVAVLRACNDRQPPRLAAPSGVGAVVRLGRPELLPSPAGGLRDGPPEFAERLGLLREANIASGLIVPLTARKRTIGALVLVNGPGRPLERDLPSIAEDLARRAAVAIDNARLFEERTFVARTLQESLLPPQLPAIEGIELAARYLPASYDIGGDFYDVFPLPSGAWVLALGDVCGKGPTAAAQTGLIRSAVRAVAMTEADPSRILALVNEAMLSQQSDPQLFTMVLGVLEPHEGGAALTVSSGGHPAPLLLRAGGLVEPAAAGGTLLGVFPDPRLVNFDVELSQGDAIVFFSDGASAPRPQTDPAHLELRLAARAGAPASALADEVLNAARDEPGKDDIAVLVLRVAG